MAWSRIRRRRLLVALTLCLCMPGLLVGLVLLNGNFGTVQSGRIYRSAQLSADPLRRTLADYRIKSVLNLRGANPHEAWYRDEYAVTLASDATHIDVSMSSCEWASRAQLRALVSVLDTCGYPLLIHCQFGSERTGLVSAFAELLRPGGTLEDARNQFTIRHLFVRMKDGKIMAEHLDQYERWLTGRGWTHTPERFRLWVAEGFVPGVPGREQWPYDPYPLVVISRPSVSPEGSASARAGGDEIRRSR